MSSLGEGWSLENHLLTIQKMFDLIKIVFDPFIYIFFFNDLAWPPSRFSNSRDTQQDHLSELIWDLHGYDVTKKQAFSALFSMVIGGAQSVRSDFKPF